MAEPARRRIDDVVALLGRAGRSAWADVDHLPSSRGFVGGARRSALALGIDLAQGQAAVARDQGDDHGSARSDDDPVDPGGDASVGELLAAVERVVRSICDQGPWRQSTAQLHTAVIDLVREFDRVGS